MLKPKIPTAEIASTINQHRLSIAIKFSVITIAVVALYFQDLSMVFNGALTNESTTFQVLAVPFLFAYLLYRKRKMINATLQPPQTETRVFQKYSSTLTGIALSAVAILTYWYGSYTFTPLIYHMITLPFLVVGLTLILFNLQTLKQLIIPIAFLIFLTPPPDQIFFSVGSALANLCASASNALANVFGMHAVLSTASGSPIITLIRPDHISLPFGVDVACSGVYSLLGFVIFALFIAYIMRGKLINKFVVLIMGIPLIVALNIIRITSILSIGYNFGENLALNLFHFVSATALLFLGTLLLLVITDKVFKQPKPPQPCPTCNPPPTNSAEPFCPNCGKLFKQSKTKLNKADIAKIAGIAIIVVMLLSIRAPVFALTQGPAQVITQTPQGIQVNTSNPMLPNIQGYTLNYLYRDTAFEQESGDDAALVYSYTAVSNDSALSVYVAIQIAASVTSEHQWEYCLVTYPLSQGNPTTVNTLDDKNIQLQANPPMTAHYFAFQYTDTNQTQVVLYWYETATFNTNNTAQTKSVMISLITYPSSPQNVTQAENQELPIANAINNYWAPIQTWSVVALAISQNGFALSIVASVILAVLIFYAVFLDKREKTQLRNMFRKLPEKNKTLITAVDNAQKEGTPSTQGIINQLQKLTNAIVDKGWLIEKLNEAQNAGLIKQAIANDNDEPTIQWKNQIPQNINLASKPRNLFH